MNKEDFKRYRVDDGGHIFDLERNKDVKIFKSNAYLQCMLYDNEGKSHVLGVHVVVAMFHCQDFFEGCLVHHQDTNTYNNYAYNLECTTRRKHNAIHADHTRLRDYVLKHGPVNKGKKMSESFRLHCNESAKARGFNGNQYVDKDGNRK